MEDQTTVNVFPDFSNVRAWHGVVSMNLDYILSNIRKDYTRLNHDLDKCGDNHGKRNALLVKFVTKYSSILSGDMEILNHLKVLHGFPDVSYND